MSPTLAPEPLTEGPWISRFWHRAQYLLQSCQTFDCLMPGVKKNILKIALILMILAPRPSGPRGGRAYEFQNPPPLHPFVLSDSGDLKMLLTSNHKIFSFNFTKVFHTKRFMLMFFLCLKCIKRRININKLIWTLLSNFISTL